MALNFMLTTFIPLPWIYMLHIAHSTCSATRLAPVNLLWALNCLGALNCLERLLGSQGCPSETFTAEQN